MRFLVRENRNRAPVPYSSGRTYSAGSIGTTLDASQQTRSLAAMGGVGTLFAITSRISQAVAGTQWCLFRKSTDARRTYGPMQERPRTEIIAKHPALSVFNRPNPFMSRQLFLEITAQHQELVGEQYWLPAQDDVFNFPVELWPIRPDKMMEVPSATDFLAGWIYRGPDGERVPLGTDEVIQLKAPNPMNMYRGMGAVQTILTELDAIKYSAEWNRNFFINGAIPGAILESPEAMQDTEFKQFQDRWRASHQGVAKAHKVAILEGGMKWVDAAYTQKDMQFIELQSASRELTREAFGMSKTMLGQTEDVNRATAEAAEYVFARWLLIARLDRIKGALNDSFLPMYGPLGEGVEFDYMSPVPEDLAFEASERTSKIDGLIKLLGLGVEPEEAMEFLGLPILTLKEKDEPQPTRTPDPEPAPPDPEEDDSSADPSQEGGED